MHGTDPISLEFLKNHSACGDGFEWAVNAGSMTGWWQICHHGDWLIWFITHLGLEDRLVIGAAAQCAELGLPHLSEIDQPARGGMDTLEAWLNRNATQEDVAEAGRLADSAFVAANLRGDTAAAYAIKAIGCVLKGTLWIKTHRYRACQFASKTCTWVAEAAGSVDPLPEGKSSRDIIDAMHLECANRVRASIPEAVVAQHLSEYLQSKNEPIASS